MHMFGHFRILQHLTNYIICNEIQLLLYNRIIMLIEQSLCVIAVKQLPEKEHNIIIQI